MSKRVSPAERLRVQIDEVFAGGQDLARAIEEVARLGALLLLQCAVEAEVAAFLGRNRYARLADVADARQGKRNGYCPTTVKTTAGPITLQRPKLRNTTATVARTTPKHLLRSSNQIQNRPWYACSPAGERPRSRDFRPRISGTSDSGHLAIAAGSVKNPDLTMRRITSHYENVDTDSIPR